MLYTAISAARVLLVVLAGRVEALLRLHLQLVKDSLVAQRLTPERHQQVQSLDARHLLRVQCLALLAFILIYKKLLVKKTTVYALTLEQLNESVT